MALFLKSYLSNSYSMDAKDINLIKKALKIAVNQYGQTWLNDLPLHGMRFKFCKTMSNKEFSGKVNGAFDVFDETIYISADYDSKSNIQQAEIINLLSSLGVILHELRHYWQRQKFGFLLYNILAVFRTITLEPAAYKAEDVGDKIFSAFASGLIEL